MSGIGVFVRCSLTLGESTISLDEKSSLNYICSSVGLSAVFLELLYRESEVTEGMCSRKSKRRKMRQSKLAYAGAEGRDAEGWAAGTIAGVHAAVSKNSQWT